jgi:hypothetical protein
MHALGCAKLYENRGSSVIGRQNKGQAGIRGSTVVGAKQSVCTSNDIINLYSTHRLNNQGKVRIPVFH